jgi:hypothetical protein
LTALDWTPPPTPDTYPATLIVETAPGTTVTLRLLLEADSRIVADDGQPLPAVVAFGTPGRLLTFPRGRADLHLTGELDMRDPDRDPIVIELDR